MTVAEFLTELTEFLQINGKLIFIPSPIAAASRVLSEVEGVDEGSASIRLNLMRRKWLFSMVGIAILLPALCFLSPVFCYYIRLHWSKPVFATYQVETTLTWTNGPDVELNPESMKELNADVTDMIEKKMPGKQLTYPVVSLGNIGLEVEYVSDKPGVPEPLQKTLNAYIEKRAAELAKEQVGGDHTK